MVIRETCLYKYKMQKSNTILSFHKHASISLFKLPQFNLICQCQRLAVGLQLFSSPFISPIYFPYIYIYVTYMLDLILHIHVYVTYTYS